MAHSLTAVAGASVDLQKVRVALLSVSDKTGLAAVAAALHARGVLLLSTGGTAAALRAAGLPVTDVSEHTGSPEIMDGRVKTLHPKIHGGLLGVRGSAAHEADMKAHGIAPIDLVLVNLYAFQATVDKGGDFATCIENIDIGGPSMIRSAAKNNAAVTVAVSPAQYPELLAELAANDGCTSSALRRRFAAEAFAHTAAYDAAIAGWFAAQVAPAAAAAASSAPPPTVVRAYTRELALKYGCNPHQAPAFCGAIVRAPAALAGGGGAQAAVPGEMPFRVLNGAPGYINLLDACNAYQLAAELFAATGLAGAASFKHVSPAGAAVAVPLPPALADVYDCAGAALTPVALAYLRARSADPLCSYGDFAAVSHVVDEATAAILKPEVSDGIVAPGYTPAALDILRAKKGGAFVILEAKPGFAPPADEYREVYGMAFAQRRNDAPVTAASVSGDSVVTAAPGGGGGRGTMPPDAVRDLLVALVSIKYTQSNSVGYALGGQMVGVGAGQQSRVDCVKLAGRKVATWWLRQHPAVLALDFKPDVKRQAKVNARVRYIEGDMTAIERGDWLLNFGAEPPPLTDGDKAAWLAKLSGVALASDAFFPFRDSLDHAAKYGVQFVAQPGGSVQDAEVTKAAEAYGMTMAHNKLRLFHH